MCGTGFFNPAKRAFCPFCHVYARALSPKINIPQAKQAKINIFCAEFQELSNGALTCLLVVCGTLFFPAKCVFSAFFTKKKFEK